MSEKVLDNCPGMGYTSLMMKEKVMIKATKTTAQQIRDYAKGWANMRMGEYLGQYDGSTFGRCSCDN